MRGMVFISSLNFFLAVMAFVCAVLAGVEVVSYVIWLTVSLFWLRFESCLAFRVQNGSEK